MTKQKVRNNLENLLDEYDYSYSGYALDRIVNEWYNQKDTLRNLFRNHPNWIEEEDMIAFDIDMHRQIDRKSVINFRDWAVDKLNYNNLGLDSTMWYDTHFPCSQFMTEETIALVQKAYPDFKASVGQKTSRAMNKLFMTLGLDKYDDYNREFAKYADALNPLKITRHTVISINLIDYLTMSFGNSWASCHTIDKNNKRGMPNNYSGCYSSGTLSYGLDETSIVFYTVDSKYNGNEYYSQPKINRQMFHFGESKLVQGRLYPQSCDNGAMDEYTQFRNLMQEIVAQCLGVPNLWKLERGTSACESVIYSEGTHYQDYRNFSNCTVSRLKNFENEFEMTVGADPICIKCGNRHGCEDNINCCAKNTTCESCGCEIDEDDSYEINGCYYCEDCVRYCENCGEYHLRENMTWVESEDGYVCDDCIDSYYRYCQHCEEYHLQDDMTWVESESEYICSDCLDEYYEYCEHCDEYYSKDDMTYISSEDKWVCQDCLEEHYTRCEDCGEYYQYENMQEYNDCYYCEDCYQEIIEKEFEEVKEDESEAI